MIVASASGQTGNCEMVEARRCVCHYGRRQFPRQRDNCPNVKLIRYERIAVSAFTDSATATSAATTASASTTAAATGTTTACIFGDGRVIFDRGLQHNAVVEFAVECPGQRLQIVRIFAEVINHHRFAIEQRFEVDHIQFAGVFRHDALASLEIEVRFNDTLASFCILFIDGANDCSGRFQRCAVRHRFGTRKNFAHFLATTGLNDDLFAMLELLLVRIRADRPVKSGHPSHRAVSDKKLPTNRFAENTGDINLDGVAVDSHGKCRRDCSRALGTLAGFEIEFPSMQRAFDRRAVDFASPQSGSRVWATVVDREIATVDMKHGNTLITDLDHIGFAVGKTRSVEFKKGWRDHANASWGVELVKYWE